MGVLCPSGISQNEAISLLQSRLVDVLEYHLLQNDYTPAQLVQAGNVTTTLGVLTGTPATLTFSQPEPNVSGAAAFKQACTTPSRPILRLPLFGVSSRPWILLICAASMRHAGGYFALSSCSIAAASRTHLCVCQNAYAFLQFAILPFSSMAAFKHASGIGSGISGGVNLPGTHPAAFACCF